MTAIVIVLALLGAPLKISHQGRILTSDGEPVTGSHDLEFSLHDETAGGAAVWSEEITGVSFDEGYYAVVLGEVEALTVADFASEDLTLGLALDGGTPFSPRPPVTSVPFA